MLGRLSGADEANVIPALGVGHEQQRVLDSADPREPFLSIVVPVVVFGNGERIGKDRTSEVERDAVFEIIRGGLGVVPLESIREYLSTAYQ